MTIRNQKREPSCGRPGSAAAAASGQSDLLSILVESGARLEDTDAAGDTALIAAAKNGQRACVSCTQATRSPRSLVVVRFSRVEIPTKNNR